MHRGVQQFVDWVEEHRNREDVRLNPPASESDISSVEQMLGGPLPSDLKIVLARFNGGMLPCGELLPAGISPGTIGATVREYAEAIGRDFLDTELLLPFLRTPEDSLLSFDRGAGPVSDTWAVVDYFQDLDEHRLMYRTFDGFCRVCVAEWTSEDFGKAFSLGKYLRGGERHSTVEPDVATAHVTVAHALKRSGEPESSLQSYLKAARCVPRLFWCDWEAMKLAVLLGNEGAALEAMERLSALPAERWDEADTSPAAVAYAALLAAVSSARPRLWERYVRRIAQACDPEQLAPYVAAFAELKEKKTVAPPSLPERTAANVALTGDNSRDYDALRAAYASGTVRDEDLLLDAKVRSVAPASKLSELLRIRRDF